MGEFMYSMFTGHLLWVWFKLASFSFIAGLFLMFVLVGVPLLFLGSPLDYVLFTLLGGAIGTAIGCPVFPVILVGLTRRSS